jgi:hypothetical protein
MKHQRFLMISRRAGMDWVSGGGWNLSARPRLKRGHPFIGPPLRRTSVIPILTVVRDTTPQKTDHGFHGSHGLREKAILFPIRAIRAIRGLHFFCQGSGYCPWRVRL